MPRFRTLDEALAYVDAVRADHARRFASDWLTTDEWIAADVDTLDAWVDACNAAYAQQRPALRRGLDALRREREAG